jgi:hypothetical protein
VKYEQIRDENLWGVALVHPVTGAALPSTAIWKKLRAWEDRLERMLSIRFRPTRIACEPPADRPTGDYDEIETAYDYDHQMMDATKHGYLRLRLGPITAITELVYGFPKREGGTTIPLEWVKVEPQYGYMRVVVNGGTAIGQVQAFVMGILGGAYTILPQTVFVSYNVGQTPEWWRANHGDLLESLAELTAADILDIVATGRASAEGSSSSVSADGLSHSTSGSHEALKTMADARRKTAQEGVEKWNQTFNGTMLAWL